MFGSQKNIADGKEPGFTDAEIKQDRESGRAPGRNPPQNAPEDPTMPWYL